MAHPTSLDSPIRCAVITVSDTRTPETDHSGQAIQAFLQQANHRILDYRIVPDEPELLRSLCTDFGRNPDIDVVILSGGTGIAPRDTTYDVIERLLEKTL
ncbi:MAG TPA: molybdenum cofactor biosynthesis protein, partial [Leptolyngbyaceae cyanobacterium M65_K2018_010]|nr:molybdenum cofactor biosynthesis protein [Leptolyngbyaceae cyanobacterium M65_K2018_010]